MKSKTLLVALAVCVSAAGCKFFVQQLVDYSEKWSSGLPKSRGSLAAGLQSGDWVYYYESGKPRAKGQYAGDRQIGAWVFYYENGVIERSGEFDDTGKRSGEWTLQYQDQTPQARGRYIADFEDGLWQFFRADGGLDRAGQFDAGKLSGPWTYYYPGGKPKAEGMYFRGDRIGPWRVYGANGEEGGQDFGSKVGVRVARETWPNGKVRREGVLLNGVPTGRWTSWHENGRLRFCSGIVDGKCSGVFEARDLLGNVVAQGVLAGGAFVGGTVVDRGGASRPLVAGPVPALGSSQPWAPDTALAALTPEALVGVHAAEIMAPIDGAVVLPQPAVVAAPAPAVQAVVVDIDQAPARVPAAEQPQFSVRQRQNMDSFVKEYLYGAPATGSVAAGPYLPAGAAPRTMAQGELKQWYGKPMPFQTMKGVDGNDIDLTQFVGKKKVMIVVLRGFLGEVCCYCVAQTKALAQSRARLDELGVEVLVIYPGAKENEQSFEKAYKMTFNEGGPPYRVFYDPDLSLVTQLGIEGDLASPSTLILDKDGKIVFFYKGEHRADRPAAKKLIEKIEEMK